MHPAATFAAVQGEEEAQDVERRVDLQVEEHEAEFTRGPGQLAFGPGPDGALAVGTLRQHLLPDLVQDGAVEYFV